MAAAISIDAAFYLDRVLPALNQGLLVSCKLIVPAAVFGFIGGVLLGTLRVYGPAAGRKVGDAVTTVVRGVPLLVQLFFIYSCLPKIGMWLDSLCSALTASMPEIVRYESDLFLNLLRLDAFASALAGFILCSAAYHSEYIRGALLSIRQGQIKAAQALGFSTRQLLFSVVVPQALRRALPGCGNEIIYLIKYSSLAYVISCIELTGEANVLAGRTYRYIEIYLAVGAYYLALTTIASVILSRLEKHFAIPGFSGKM